MATPVFDVRLLDGASAALARAAAVLRAGGLVAFPTETVYGLGASALDADAVGRIFVAKGRPANNPLIVHIAEVREALRVAAVWPEMAQRLADRFWPGPLTLVLPRGPDVPDGVTARGPTVAVRLPAHPIARELIRLTGTPIAAPSANRSNHLSPTLASHVLRDLDGRVDLILDGGPTSGGIESTVLDLSGGRPRLLRPGPIAPDVLEAIVGPVERAAPVRTSETEALASPGMLDRHYAPRTPMVCVEDGRELVRQWSRAGLRVAWVVWFPVEAGDVPEGVQVVRLPDDASGYAALLYQTLHRLDDAGLDRIVTAWPPADDAWLGVRDRLRRGSST